MPYPKGPKLTLSDYRTFGLSVCHRLNTAPAAGAMAKYCIGFFCSPILKSNVELFANNRTVGCIGDTSCIGCRCSTTHRIFHTITEIGSGTYRGYAGAGLLSTVTLIISIFVYSRVINDNAHFQQYYMMKTIQNNEGR